MALFNILSRACQAIRDKNRNALARALDDMQPANYSLQELSLLSVLSQLGNNVDAVQALELPHCLQQNIRDIHACRQFLCRKLSLVKRNGDDYLAYCSRGNDEPVFFLIKLNTLESFKILRGPLQSNLIAELTPQLLVKLTHYLVEGVQPLLIELVIPFSKRPFFLEQAISKSSLHSTNFSYRAVSTKLLSAGDTLLNCTPGAWAGNGYYSNGMTCFTQNAQIILFPHASQHRVLQSNAVYFSRGYEDVFESSHCQSISFNGHLSVACKAAKSSIIYTSKRAHPTVGQLAAQLLLGKCLWQIAKQIGQWITKKDTKATVVPITNEKKLQWRTALTELQNIVILAAANPPRHPLINNEQCRKGTSFLLSDCEEKLTELEQKSSADPGEIKRFNENLEDLQEDLEEINSPIRVYGGLRFCQMLKEAELFTRLTHYLSVNSLNGYPITPSTLLVLNQQNTVVAAYGLVPSEL